MLLLSFCHGTRRSHLLGHLGRLGFRLEVVAEASLELQETLLQRLPNLQCLLLLERNAGSSRYHLSMRAGWAHG